MLEMHFVDRQDIVFLEDVAYDDIGDNIDLPKAGYKLSQRPGEPSEVELTHPALPHLALECGS